MVGQEPYLGHKVVRGVKKLYRTSIAFSSNYNHPQLEALKNVFRKLSVCKWYPNDLGYLIEQGVFLMNIYRKVGDRPLQIADPKELEFSIKVINRIIDNSGQVPVITFGNHPKYLVARTKATNVYNEIHPASLRYNRSLKFGDRFIKGVKNLDIIWGKEIIK